MVFQEGDDPPVPKHPGRLLPGEAPPPCVGQPKGLNQALFERSKLEGALMSGSKKKPSNRSERTEAVHHWLEENGGQVTGIDPDTGKDKGASAWPGACGSAVEDTNCGHLLGCNDGVGDGGCLLLCSFVTAPGILHVQG
jgi:hypothetical protein